MYTGFSANASLVETTRFIQKVFREHSLSCRHEYEKHWLLLDVDLEAGLQELVEMTENLLNSTEQSRKQTVIRVDGGGADKNIDGLLQRGYWKLIKVKNWQRTQKLAQTVTTWRSLPELLGHDVGWVETPHEYAKATRQLANPLAERKRRLSLLRAGLQLRYDETGKIHSIVLNQSHKLA